MVRPRRWALPLPMGARLRATLHPALERPARVLFDWVLEGLPLGLLMRQSRSQARPVDPTWIGHAEGE